MNTEELNALKDRAYKTAVAHGRKCMWIRRNGDGLFCGLALKQGKRVRLDNNPIKHCDKKQYYE